MKHILLSAFALLLIISASAQTFYVEPTDKGYESKIKEKLRAEGFSVTPIKKEATYHIECVLDGKYNFWATKPMFKGLVVIKDSTGTEIARTAEVKRSPAMTNGFSAAENIFGVIADRKLIPIIDKIVNQ